jgi:hypothetical protein
VAVPEVEIKQHEKEQHLAVSKPASKESGKQKNKKKQAKGVEQPQIESKIQDSSMKNID